MTRRLLAVTLLVCATGAGRAQELPPDLALVPEGTYAFAHVRLAEIAGNPAFADYRASLAAAGPKALAAFDAQFAPAPTTTDRVTVALVPDGKPNPGPAPLVILRFSEKFDAKRVVASYSSDPTPKVVKGVPIHRVDDDTSLATVDDEVILVGPAGAIGLALAKADKSKELLGKLARAADGKSVAFATASRKGVPVPPGFDSDIPPQFRPLAQVEELTLSFGLGGNLSAALSARYPSEAAAKAAERAIADAAREGRKQLAIARAEAEKALFQEPPVGKGRPLEQLPQVLAQLSTLAGAASFDAQLAKLPITRTGDTLDASGSVAAGTLGTPLVIGASIGLLLPAVQKVREAAARSTSQNNLKQLSLAIHNYESANGKFPPAASLDKAGKPLLSWRVAILPYLEQPQLYKQFKLDEPWDSEHNKKLIPLMPKSFADARLPTTPGLTIYKVFTGSAGGFNPGKKGSFIGITDGMSNTAMIAAGGEPVVWTKPDDFAFDGQKLPNLSAPGDNLLVAMFDGSVRVVRVGAGGVDEKLLKALITPAGGEAVNVP